jgi:Phage integrase family
MCSSSCSGSVATCATSPWNDYLWHRSMHRLWRHSSIIWPMIGMPRFARKTIASQLCMRSSAMCSRKYPSACCRASRSSPFLCGDMRARASAISPKEYLAQVLAQPDLRTRAGRRDAVLLSVLYDTGARVQELIDLNAGDVRLDPPPQVRLMGKGRKMRAIPLMDATVELLRDHRRDNNLDRPEHADKPLFQNRQGGRLSRSGIRYLLQKYVQPVRRDHPGFTQPVSPHSLRHTKGMHLLQSGVPLEIIRDFLGHVDVKTTEIYARANLEMKRKALEKAADGTPLPKIPSWKQNKTLLEWLHSL